MSKGCLERHRGRRGRWIRIIIASQGFYEWSIPSTWKGRQSSPSPSPISQASLPVTRWIPSYVSDGETVERPVAGHGARHRRKRSTLQRTTKPQFSTDTTVIQRSSRRTTPGCCKKRDNAVNNAFFEMRHISKSFPGVKALDDGALSVAEGGCGLVGGERRGQIDAHEDPQRQLQER